MAPALSSRTSLPNVSRKASDAFTSSSNSMPFFGRNEAWRKKLLFEKVSRASIPVAESIVWPLLVAWIFPARSNESTSKRTTSKSQPNGSFASSSARNRPLAVSP